MPASGVLGEEGLEFSVEGGGLDLVQRLVEHVLVLLREQLPEPVGDPGSHPHADGLPPEFLDRRESACSADEEPVKVHRDRLQ